MFDFIAYPMGQFLYFIYNSIAFSNYGLAIIILTLIIRIIILPINVKQYKSLSRMQELQPKMVEIQKRYKNDKEKLNQEMMKFYQENHYNPAGGCLPMLIQLPVLYSLFWVISQPLKFMLKLSPEEIAAKATQFNVPNSGYQQIDIIEAASKAGERILDMNFLGANLGLMPTWNFDKISANPQYLVLLLIPILVAISTFISTKFSTPKNNNASADNQMAASMQRSMLYMMPFMLAFFSFQAPAGLGLYWIVGNVIQILQQLFMNKFIVKKKEVEAK